MFLRLQGLENVRLIAVGAFHNLALQEDGTLWAWGNNEYGQLGTGDTQPRSEPIPVQGLSARCNLGYNEQNEWYFFSHKDKKYPTGTRTNRATAAGFWKATGRDKAVLSKNKIIGMGKTLVFYKGRAPNGRKTDWIMHEYQHQTSEHGPPQASLFN
ncbi:hypothetical protein REPUB_Repub01dG0192200 [Reevesia pubescens]